LKPTKRKPLRRVEILAIDEILYGGGKTVEVLGKWKPIKFRQLRKGDIYRLWDTNDAGVEVPDELEKGQHAINVALTNATPAPPTSYNHKVSTILIRGYHQRRK
jgi:hypothetical protein